MSNPTVACVMLANGRPEMVKRAVKSFRSQTYGAKALLVFDTGAKSVYDFTCGPGPVGSIVHFNRTKNVSPTIGGLRNDANEFLRAADIICHWDSDDWSQANRIAEQVALLRSSGAECVGYNEMLFWAENALGWIGAVEQSWLYRAAVPNYAVGTSMCYWRETWQRNPFPDRSDGCDDLDWFNRGVKIASEPAFALVYADDGPIFQGDPRMIASIHGGNTCSKIDASKREWSRVPNWDAYCREAMKL